MKRLGILALALLMSCGTAGKAKTYEKGRADIVSTMGDTNISGTVVFTETAEGLKVEAVVEGLPPGKHGFHVHEFGDISDEGRAAGGHYNPDNTKHGDIIRDGFENAHAGDFGNIDIDENGKGQLSLVVPKLQLNGGRYNVAGRAVIIHEKKDDFGQPTGNAGGRIAGGAIIIVGE